MPSRISRRYFLRVLGSGTALGPALPSLLARAYPASDRIRVGIIGVGDLGHGYHIDNVLRLPDLELVAVADVDQEHIDRAVKKIETRGHGKAAGYRDYRRILDRKDIDAVIVVTPDHWHSLVLIHACQAGKDVFCEKPLSLTIAEGRAMVQAARRYRRVVQTGTQQRSAKQFRWACELVRNGHIGKLERVKVVLGSGPTSPFVADTAPPESLDWDFWLGPAPLVPYNEKRCRYTFRWFFDYSGGKLTDWGAHHLDIVQWGLDSEHSGPVEVSAKGHFPADSCYETPTDFDVHYRYANDVTVHATAAGKNGVTFYGTQGEVFVSRSGISSKPKEILETAVDTGPILLAKSLHHHENWLECLRSRKRPISDVEIGHRSASVAHIGNIAMRLGRKLRWDPDAELFPDDETANRYVHKPMRHPWSL